MRNTRDDEYGPQNFENRTRFICETIKAIKAECGNDFPVQVLINGIEENDGTIGDSALYTTVAENKAMCKLMEEAGVNSFHVRLGPTSQHVCEFASDLYFTGYGIDGHNKLRYAIRFLPPLGRQDNRQPLRLRNDA